MVAYTILNLAISGCYPSICGNYTMPVCYYYYCSMCIINSNNYYYSSWKRMIFSPCACNGELHVRYVIAYILVYWAVGINFVFILICLFRLNDWIPDSLSGLHSCLIPDDHYEVWKSGATGTDLGCIPCELSGRPSEIMSNFSIQEHGSVQIYHLHFDTAIMFHGV